MSLLRLDFTPPHRPPSAGRVILATLLSIAGSLLADAALVAIAIRVFPSTKGYVHFQFHDYGKLTVIGVVIACVAWRRALPAANIGTGSPYVALSMISMRASVGSPLTP